MRHNDDAFTAMLLTLPLTANKDELVARCPARSFPSCGQGWPPAARGASAT